MSDHSGTRVESSVRLPRHVAIIMDGNGRWAEQRLLPRYAGHRAGAETVKRIVESSGQKGIEALTLFAFSSENWQRPKEEVGMLMSLFISTLENQVSRLHKNDVRLRVIGDRSAFNEKLQAKIREAEELTSGNQGLNLAIAANYGGRWDITEAVRRVAARVLAGELAVEDITASEVAEFFSLADLPEPDLFIRTGGEHRISNFLLWQLAYTELYFTDILWPDFDQDAFEGALLSFATRQRRYGRTGRQVTDSLQE